MTLMHINILEIQSIITPVDPNKSIYNLLFTTIVYFTSIQGLTLSNIYVIFVG